MEEPSKKQWHRFEKLRNPKHFRRRLRKAESASLKHAHTFVVSRWSNVMLVRRHVFAWLGLMVVLIGSLVVQGELMRRSYQSVAAVEGGTYSEGVIGQLNTLNPIFATSQPERSAARLLFAGLLTYDEAGALKNDLAQKVVTEEGGKRYTVTLRPQLQWQDGAPITSRDVVFTVNTIKNIDVRSPLYSSWRDISVKAVDERTVQFDLPNVYAPFPHLLTVGILPQHKLSDTPAENIRSSLFDRNPVGSGPFEFRSLQIINADQERLVLHLSANPRYHLGKVKLERFQLHTYGDREQLLRAFRSGEVIAAADLTAKDIAQLQEVDSYVVKDVPLNNVAMALMKTSEGPLADVALRKALRDATDRKAAIRALEGRVKQLDTPLPTIGNYTFPDMAQPAYDFASAEKQLDQAGWKRGTDGKRAKDGQPLKLTLATVRSGDYPKLLATVAASWMKLGVIIDTVLADPADIQQNVLTQRAYDVLLYELAIGADPDVFPYWHSSQANPRGLNLANYSNGAADDALVSARNRVEPDLRLAKYRTFSQQWLSDVPAIVLYQPTLHYVSRTSVEAVQEKGSLVDPVDRYRNVQYWAKNADIGNQTP